MARTPNDQRVAEAATLVLAAAAAAAATDTTATKGRKKHSKRHYAEIENPRPADPELRIRSGLRSLFHRNRRAVAPWLVALAVAAVGYGLWALATLIQRPGLVAGVVVILALPAIALGIWRRRRHVHPYWLGWAALAALNALAWVVVTVALGWSVAGLAWLVVSTALLGLRWWHRVRHPYPTSDPRDLPPPPDPGVTDVDELVERWDRYVRPKVLAGASLSHVQRYRHGLRCVINLVPGSQTLTTALTAHEAIGSALGHYPEEVVIEADRTRPPTELSMRVITDSPIKRVVHFGEPRYENGAILLGPYADGIGEARWRLYGEDSMYGGYILGSPGSGKSRLAEIIAIGAMARTPTVIVYLDGQAGASSPLLWKHSLWQAGPDDAQDVLEALLQGAGYRQDYNRYYTLTGFDPTPDRPGVLVIVDECHRIFTRETAEAWAILVREGRKLGIAVLAMSQVATLDAFGNSDALRSSIVNGNAVALRTASAIQAQVLPGLGPINLSKLPKWPGYGYTVNESGDPAAGRTAPFRAAYLADRRRAASLQLPPGHRVAEDWFEAFAPSQALDDGTATALGPAFIHRDQLAAARRAELEARFRRGATAPLRTTRTGGNVLRLVVPDALELPTFDPAPVPHAPHGAGAESRPRVSEAQQRVLDTIEHGITAPGDIAEHLGISTQALHKTLTRLLAAGHIVKSAHGQYTLSA